MSSLPWPVERSGCGEEEAVVEGASLRPSGGESESETMGMSLSPSVNRELALGNGLESRHLHRLRRLRRDLHVHDAKVLDRGQGSLAVVLQGSVQESRRAGGLRFRHIWAFDWGRGMVLQENLLQVVVT